MTVNSFNKLIGFSSKTHITILPNKPQSKIFTPRSNMESKKKRIIQGRIIKQYNTTFGK